MVAYQDGLPAQFPQMATHPSTNSAVHSREWNLQRADRMSNTLVMAFAFYGVIEIAYAISFNIIKLPSHIVNTRMTTMIKI